MVKDNQTVSQIASLPKANLNFLKPIFAPQKCPMMAPGRGRRIRFDSFTNGQGTEIFGLAYDEIALASPAPVDTTTQVEPFDPTKIFFVCR